MLNRRHALLAASGVVAAGTSQLLGAAEGSSAVADHAQPQPDRVQQQQTARTTSQAAEACIACAAECDSLLNSATVSKDTRRLAADCRDICTVTATLLSRQTRVSPAICQACQDACERMANHAKSANPSINYRAVDSAVACVKALRAIASN